MSQSSAVFAALVRAIPAEHDAAFVAQVGQRGRITSRAGTVDIGSVALTVAAVDELNASIFPPERLQALQESGLAQFDFAMPGIDGSFTAMAGSNSDDRWLDIRRRMPATPASIQPSARPTAVPQAAAPQAAPPQAAAPQAAVRDDDLIDLASLDFPARETDADQDWLNMPEGLFEGPAVAPGGRQTVTATADDARVRPIVDRRRPGRRTLQAALAGAACLVAALLGARSFGATRLPPPVRTAAAKTSPAARTSPPPAVATAALSASPAVAAAVPLASPAVATAAPSASPVVATAVRSASPAVAIAAPSASPAPRPVTSDAPPPQVAAHSRTAAPSAPAAQTAALSEEPSRSGFSVQVAAVPTRDEADRIVTRFVGQGYPAYMVRGDGAAANLYRVRIGTFPDRKAAEEVARHVEGTDGIKPWIAKEISEDKPAAPRVLRGDGDSNRR